MSEIKFSCPHCDQHIACDESLTGVPIRCPACQREITVPHASPASSSNGMPATRYSSNPTRSRHGTSGASCRSRPSEIGMLIAGAAGVLILASIGFFVWNHETIPSPRKAPDANVAGQTALSSAEATAMRALVAGLRDKDREACKETALEVIRTGKPAVPALLELLREKSSLTRANALLVIGQIGQISDLREVASTITNLWSDPDPNVRRGVLSALVCIKPDTKVAMPILLAALNDPNGELKKRAMFSIRLWPAEAKPAVPLLIKLLKDRDSLIRAHAAGALAQIGAAASEAAPALKAALNDADPEVPRYAAHALRSISGSKPTSTR